MLEQCYAQIVKDLSKNKRVRAQLNQNFVQVKLQFLIYGTTINLIFDALDLLKFIQVVNIGSLLDEKTFQVKLFSKGFALQLKRKLDLHPIDDPNKGRVISITSSLLDLLQKDVL